MTSDAVKLGARWELMVDDHLVQQAVGLTPRLHEPVPREVVLVHDKPWEGNGCGYHTVFRDGDLYRMYYKAWHITPRQGQTDQSRPTVTAYAESRNGIAWTKPELGLREYGGSTRNNLVWTGEGSHNFAPFIDRNPSCPPEHRYKAFGGLKSREHKGLLPFSSPDAVHWTPMAGEAVITDGAFDSQNIAFWDSIHGVYRAFYRDFRVLPDGRRSRDVKTAVSPDFLNWSEGEWLVYNDEAPVDQLYTNQVFPYHRAPHLLIGLPARYVERPWSEAIEQLPELELRRLRSTGHFRYGTAVTDTVLMTSRDGKRFKRWGEAFIRPGLRPRDNWTYGDNYVAWQLVETASDISGAPPELSFYSTEGYFRHSSNWLRRYTLRLDGFVSMHAGRAGGEFVTPPLTFSGCELVVNFSASAAGGVRVEVQAADSAAAIPGFSLDDSIEALGDDLARPLRWRGSRSVGELSGRPVRLRFVLSDADLYAFGFRGDP